MLIQVVESESPNGHAMPFEHVERKGVGHPDTICDAVAERTSRYYSQYCLKRFGRVAHHWFDKVMLLGGESALDYGSGRLVKPYDMILVGKAAFSVGSERIPVRKLFQRAAEDVLSEVLRGFDPSKHVRCEVRAADHQGAGRQNSRYRPHSVDDLVDLEQCEPVSNDSNLLVGFAPLSTLESIVLRIEQYLNGKEWVAKEGFTGSDVKVLGARIGDRYSLLVNIPFLANRVNSLQHYFELKDHVCGEIRHWIRDNYQIEPELLVNATDRNGRPYLTALGSVADTGDIGVVGRGNRANGLITPNRPMSIEAPSGKNPLDHTGKLYTVMAQKIAQRLYGELSVPVYVYIWTSKEKPIRDPDQVIIKLGNRAGSNGSKGRIDEVVTSILENHRSIQREIIVDGVTLW